jgi:hypothetical protein
MTTDGPPPPPEGKLLRTTRERAIPKLSIRAAAARIGISPEHWGNVERGYKSVSAGEPPVRVDPPAEMLAKMAVAVGVDPDRMRAEGNRPDVAGLMGDISLPRDAPAPPADDGEPDPNAIAFAEAFGVRVNDPDDPFLRSVRRDIAAAVMRHGVVVTGEQIFTGEPWSAGEARFWGSAPANRRSRELYVAGFRAERAQREAATNGGRHHGTAGLAVLVTAGGP